MNLTMRCVTNKNRAHIPIVWIIEEVVKNNKEALKLAYDRLTQVLMSHHTRKQVK